MDQDKKKTLCWDCIHAVPKFFNGEYIRGCEWSIDLEPVPGWTATKKPIKYCGKTSVSYHVVKCPKFVRG